MDRTTLAYLLIALAAVVALAVLARLLQRARSKRRQSNRIHVKTER